MPEFEILAPAGNLDTLTCAINNGADAVYIGGQAFSARKNAVNFTNEEIEKAVMYAHRYDAKVYVTVNTLIYDSEFDELYKFIDFLYTCGVDALIIQDLGVLALVKRCFRDFEVHASTQMTIHNVEGARIAKELGFKRVVLSRELTFEEIKRISQSVDIELEVFVHGALCMSYSGQCLMSSFIGGRSGNRGDCAQPCRLPYTLMSADGSKLSEKEKYLLSLKDLCLVDEIAALADCGVKSLKIEGRMKSAEYVSVVTSVYNKYRQGDKVAADDYATLENIFSRSGFTKGYPEGKTGRHMLNYEKNNDNVYNNISKDVRELADNLKNKRHAPIEFTAKACVKMGKPMELTVCAKDKTVTLTGSINAERAVNVAITKDRLIEQIGKSGSTPFALAGAEIDVDPGVSLPVKEVNNLRRDALTLLDEKICTSYRKSPAIKLTAKKIEGKIYDKINLHAEVRTMEQLKSAINAGFDKILIPYGLYANHKDIIDNMGQDFAVVLPSIVRDNRRIDMSILSGEVYASNLSQLAMCGEKKVNANYNINAFNSSSLDFLKELGVNTVCISPEMNLKELSAMTASLDKEIIIYGRLTLMTVQNCVIKSAIGSCGCTDNHYLLRDRKAVCFPLFADKASCTNTICNSLPLYMADKLDAFPTQGISAMRFIFTTENAKDISNIYRMYANREKASFDFTRGHYFRGV